MPLHFQLEITTTVGIFSVHNIKTVCWITLIGLTNTMRKSQELSTEMRIQDFIYTTQESILEPFLNNCRLQVNDNHCDHWFRWSGSTLESSRNRRKADWLLSSELNIRRSSITFKLDWSLQLITWTKRRLEMRWSDERKCVLFGHRWTL